MSDASITSIVTGVVTVTTLIIGVITLLIKQRTTDIKLDKNTELTKYGTAQALKNAQVASVAVNEAKEAAKYASENLVQILNGSLDDRMRSIVKEHTEPIIKAFADHNEQDDRNMKEIRQSLVELKECIK